jgi:ribosomal protein S18 acetylase RimI-like enzyme
MNTTPTTRVRRATGDDAVTLAQLRYAFRVERRPAIEAEQEFVARCTSWIQSRLSRDSPWRAWVLERERSVVGNIWLQIVEKLPNPGVEPELHGYISNFFVRPGHRSVGCGTSLLRAALEHCGEQDVDSVFLWPTERSKSLYERHGFRPGSGMFVLDRS